MDESRHSSGGGQDRSSEDSEEDAEEALIAPWDMLKTAMELKSYVEQVWDTYDIDGNGALDFDEAHDLVKDTLQDLQIELDLSKEDYVAFFEHLDRDGNKTLNKKEIAIFLISLERGQQLTED